MPLDYENVRKKIASPTVLEMVPFERKTLGLNLEALKENIQFAIDGGIRKGKGVMIVPCGTGEYVALSPEEHRLVVETSLDAADVKLPIVAGVSGCDYREVVKLGKSSTEAGVECVMVPPPYYYGTSQPDMVRWYRLIAREVKAGIMTYSQPWRNSGMSFTTSFIREMASLENVVSIKTGGEQLMEYIEMLETFSKRFAFIDNSRGYTATMTHARCVRVHNRPRGLLARGGGAVLGPPGPGQIPGGGQAAQQAGTVLAVLLARRRTAEGRRVPWWGRGRLFRGIGPQGRPGVRRSLWRACQTTLRRAHVEAEGRAIQDARKCGRQEASAGGTRKKERLTQHPRPKRFDRAEADALIVIPHS
jgi:hypothetical protein